MGRVARWWPLMVVLGMMLVTGTLLLAELKQCVLHTGPVGSAARTV